MPIRRKILLAMTTVILIACACFTIILYNTQRDTLLAGIDAELLTAAESAHALLPADYHDRITGQRSVPPREYVRIVEAFNKLCRARRLQYVWSVMRIDGVVRFTTATSPSHDAARNDQAAFFEAHTNPEFFARAFEEMKIDYSSFENKWGRGRSVLVPYLDSHGRPYAFGASMDTSAVQAVLQRTLWRSLLLGAVMLAAGTVLSMLLARSFSRPITEITQVARAIAAGDLTRRALGEGGTEVSSLADSINQMSGAIRDKLAELEARRENMAVTLRSIGDGVITTDVSGRVTAMNPIAEGLTGWSEAEAHHLPLNEIFQTLDAGTGAALEDPAARTLGGAEGEAPRHADLRARSGEMRHIAYSAAPIRKTDGKTLGVVLVFRDVSEQYRNEAEKSRLISILESTSDLIATADPALQVMYLNRAGRALLGWGEDLKERKVTDAHPEWARDLLRTQAIPAAIKAGRWMGETAVLNAAGKEVPISQVIMAHRSQHGRIEFLSTIMRDLSEQRCAEEERRRLEAQLRHAQKLEMLGTLAGGIAHDFNNILSPIIGYAELATYVLPEGEPLRDDMAQIIKAGRRGADLVQQILMFSGKAEQERTLLEMKPLVVEVMEMARAVLPSSIAIDTDLPDDLPAVVADPTQIRQVLMNLITNAAQAMTTGAGRLGVKLALEESAEMRQCRGTVLPPGKYVAVTVSDTGCGMEAAVLERIFEPFFSTKEVGKGTGLGLAVVEGIVGNHGGGIAVTSKVGEGSRFSVYFPASDGEPGRAAQSVEARYPGGNEHVLVVDDENLIVYMTQRMLERLGYTVSTAAAGDEAREKFQAASDQIDLVISDQTMPDMTGMELAAALRKIRPDLPIILTSGYHEAVGAAEARQAGIEGYLKKPVGMQQLSSTVRRVLDGRIDKLAAVKSSGKTGD